MYMYIHSTHCLTSSPSDRSTPVEVFKKQPTHHVFTATPDRGPQGRNSVHIRDSRQWQCRGQHSVQPVAVRVREAPDWRVSKQARKCRGSSRKAVP
ncbi:hypothetical protein CB0940_00741 [Cercospora beticola]|uniref:Uncharacterized protein n=1 Tax=Cercospora beticola TaxID=122368 RepID=A0A2G5ID18_CERBT|nr:hypothetical protein CB0940_00741 [Cercospora beticola]PIB02679.1 hypothetical protein CB0940_00741 [Cercospora beticola]